MHTLCIHYNILYCDGPAISIQLAQLARNKAVVSQPQQMFLGSLMAETPIYHQVLKSACEAAVFFFQESFLYFYFHTLSQFKRFCCCSLKLMYSVRHLSDGVMISTLIQWRSFKLTVLEMSRCLILFIPLFIFFIQPGIKSGGANEMRQWLLQEVCGV